MPSFSGVVRPKSGIPNWALGLLSCALVGATYAVSLGRLGRVDDQLEKEVQRQETVERQEAEARAAALRGY
jgi:hypothetical protein